MTLRQMVARVLGHKKHDAGQEPLGDFTTTREVIPITLLATGIGIFSAFVALALLRLIGIFTNLFFYQRWGTAMVSPAGNHLGWLEVLVPMVGGLIVGLMARYGSERIRGHGIPEAIEAILLKGGQVEPRVAILKPISSAISIGSGGPFGAEGPIIMTGGAFRLHDRAVLPSHQRRTQNVAGRRRGRRNVGNLCLAAGGRPAVGRAAALRVEAAQPDSRRLASAAAAATRRYIIGMGPLFPTPPHAAFIGPQGLLGCLLVGLLAGGLSALLTLAVYAAEDAFTKLPIHWMWWPIIGGFVVGLGGLIFPQALGVGYDTIGSLLQGHVLLATIAGILLVKSVIWAVSLGSGTSGGVLAPLLMMGGALGGLLSAFLPNEGLGFWPLIAMGAILGGTMRSPFTGVVFAVELTHDVNVILPLLLASVVAHAFTVLTLKRSILTEKVARRGYHLSREYAVDPLEILFVREVMRSNIAAIPADTPVADLAKSLHDGQSLRRQRLYPVVDHDHKLVGVVLRRELQRLMQQGNGHGLAELIRHDPKVAYPDEPLRVVVYRMAETGLTRFPVVERDGPRKLVGMVSLDDLLKARAHTLDAERRRERVLPLRLMFPSGWGKRSVG